MRPNIFPKYMQEMIKAAIHGDNSALEDYRLCRYKKSMITTPQTEIDVAFLAFFKEQLNMMTSFDKIPKLMIREALRTYMRLDSPDRPEIINILKKNIHTKNTEIHAALQELANDDSECMKAIFELAVKKAESGDRSAQYILGRCYKSGLGTRKNLPKAFQCFQKAVGTDSTEPFNHLREAERSLAHTYLSGLGVPKNSAEGLRYLKGAAEKNDPQAQFFLGLHYESEQRAKIAFGHFKQAAKQGHSAAQLKVGFCYAKRVGVEVNLKKAFNYYQQAALEGSSRAQFEIAERYQIGTTAIKKNTEKALFYYLKAAKLGLFAALLKLFRRHKDNPAFRQALPELLPRLEQSAEQGDINSKYILALFYEDGLHVTKDLGKAFHYFSLSAATGNHHAQAKLGYFYETGITIPKDLGKAYELYDKAAVQNNPIALYRLGVFKENGTATQASFHEAFHLYKEAAKQNHAAAQYRLGYLHEYGLASNIQIKEAFNLYHLAANQGIAAAQCRLGELYETGFLLPPDKGAIAVPEFGIDKDVKKAFNYYQLAASKGFLRPQYKLGLCYLTGIGVNQDISKAYDYLLKAAIQGMGKAFLALHQRLKDDPTLEKSLSELLTNYQQKARQNDPEALYTLGRFYEKTNSTQTAHHFQMSASLGFKEGVATD